jgi:hypothetical protein
MKFVKDIRAESDEIGLPIKIGNDREEAKPIDWNEYNFPKFYPLINYSPNKITDKEKQKFVQVF